SRTLVSPTRPTTYSQRQPRTTRLLSSWRPPRLKLAQGPGQGGRLARLAADGDSHVRLPRATSKSMPRQRRPAQKKSKKSRPRTPVPSDEEEEVWYHIKGILQERKRRGRTEYLVDWEPDEKTGKPYDPTWSFDVTDDVKKEWEAKKADLAAGAASSSNTSEESQPPRPSNWRQLQRAGSQTQPKKRSFNSIDEQDSQIQENSQEAQDAPSPKRARVDRDSEEPAPSITSSDSLGTTSDISGGVEQDDSVAPQNFPITVEIFPGPGFDPTGYRSVNNTHSTGHSSQSLAELEEEDCRIAISSQLSEKVIPDSQELSGQSWPSHPTQRSSVPQKTDSGVRRTTNPSATVPDERRQGSIPQPPSLQLPRVEAPPSSGLTHGQVNFNSQQHLHHISGSATTGTLQPSSAESKTQGLPESQGAHSSTCPSKGSDIPSHQPPEHISPSEAYSELRPGTVSENGGAISVTGTAGGSKPDEIARSPEGEFQSQPTFLTQPPFTPEAFPTSTQPSSRSTLSRRRRHSGIMDGTGSDRQETPSHGEPATDFLKQYISMDDIMSNLSSPQVDAQHQPSLLQGIGGMLGSSNESAPVLPSTTASEDISKASQLENDSQTMGLPDSSAYSVEPASTAPPPAMSAAAVLSPNEVELPESCQLQTVLPGHLGVQQETIAPSDISKHGPDTFVPSMPVDMDMPSYNISEQSIVMAQLSNAHADDHPTSSDYIIGDTAMHLVTLPFQARARPLYGDVINEYREPIVLLDAIFHDPEMSPEPQLLNQIEDFFRQLRGICDYPQDVPGTALEALPAAHQAKHAHDANSKFNFVLELLQGIRKETRVLIVARTTGILRLLYSITEALEVECSWRGSGNSTNGFSNSVVMATLALPNEDVDPAEFDVIVGFDHSFQSSLAASKLASASSPKTAALIMNLAITHSIDHLEAHIRGDLSPLERTYALVSSVFNARKLATDPERGYLEPHAVAKQFYDYINRDTMAVEFVPVSVPDDVLNIFQSSQTQPQTQSPPTESENERKRKHDDGANDVTKRLKLSPARETSIQDAVLNDEVRRMLTSVTPGVDFPGNNGSQVAIPTATLELLAEKFADMEHRIADNDRGTEYYQGIITNLEAHNKSYEKTYNKIYERFRKAVGDRTAFEREKMSAENALQAARDSSKAENDKLRTRITELEATLSRFTAADGESPEGLLARNEGLLKTAQGHAQGLEKRLENAKTNEQYLTNRYQSATASVTTMRREIEDLEEQKRHLQQHASENFVEIQKIQADKVSHELLSQNQDLKAQLRDREVEIERLREEIRQTKKTRAVSTPRSPRLGVMSPRIGRGAAGASSSRGTSPTPMPGLEGVPGMQYMAGGAQPGSGRWNRLLD
ncbi:hypothetical protein S7711_06436, partial [Stachybotrys chartarum IBT 7711]